MPKDNELLKLEPPKVEAEPIKVPVPRKNPEDMRNSIRITVTMPNDLLLECVGLAAIEYQTVNLWLAGLARQKVIAEKRAREKQC
jgi:hypothetical protein